MNEQSHKAVVKWLPEDYEASEVLSDEKKSEVENAIANLIGVLDNTSVVEILFSKIENNGQQENKEESGSADVGA